MSGVTLNSLLSAVKGNDTDGSYAGLTYQPTSNQTYEGDQSALPWLVFFGWGSWDNFPTLPPISPTEKAAIETVKTGSNGSKNVFIDICNLGDIYPGWMDDPKATSQGTVLQSLASVVNSLSPDVTPIIRVIIGNPTYLPSDPTGSETAASFFQGSQFTHPNAKLYIGFYSPSIGIKIDWDADKSGIPNLIKTSLEAHIMKFESKAIGAVPEERQEVVKSVISRIRSDFDKISKLHFNIVFTIIRSTGWNHAKIFAVNNSVLFGGHNWLREYTTQYPDFHLFDLGMKFAGGSATQAHLYCDDIWNYLNNISPIDTWSWESASPLGATQDFQPAPAPLWQNSQISEQPAKSQDTETIQGLAIASVTRNLPNRTTEYPVLAFNGIRDLTLNFLYAYGQQTDSFFDYGALLSSFVTDQELSSLLTDLGISSGAWSSRYGRVWAISQAKSSVKLMQQSIVNDVVKQYAPGVKQYLGIDWDGLIYPYDLLTALGQALSNGAEVQIVCSAQKQTGPGGDYHDAVSGTAFKDRLKFAMQTLALIGVISIPYDQVITTVDTLVTYKNVPPPESPNPNAPPFEQHSKAVVVDDTIMYLGSDNAYPNYNDQFGGWIEGPEVQAFVKNYFDHLWKFAV